MPIPDLQFLITAILVQKETGGNLALILDKTSHVLRERVRVPARCGSAPRKASDRRDPDRTSIRDFYSE